MRGFRGKSLQVEPPQERPGKRSELLVETGVGMVRSGGRALHEELLDLSREPVPLAAAEASRHRSSSEPIGMLSSVEGFSPVRLSW